MNTNRRAILGLGAALALPVWMARAFSSDKGSTNAGLEPRAVTLDEAKARARELGKPLLVVLTDPEGQASVAGYVWGEFFAHADRETWLDLALVEVVCLSRAAAGVADAKPDAAPAWAVVIETDAVGGAPRVVRGRLPAPAPDSSASSEEYGASVRKRAAALARMLRTQILPDESTRERRRTQSNASVQMADPNWMEDAGRREAALGTDPTVRFVDLDRFAALARFGDAPSRLEQLALAARMRLFEHDPVGARWHTSSDYCPPCGMGHVSPASRYFLNFFAQ